MRTVYVCVSDFSIAGWPTGSTYCIVVHFSTLRCDSAYPTLILSSRWRCQMMKKEWNGQEGYEREVDPALSRVKHPPALSLVHSLALRSLSVSLSHVATTANRPCSLLSTNTHIHSTFASLNSLIFACVCVCGFIISVSSAGKKKNFYHKKRTAFVFFWVDWKRSKRNVSQKYIKKKNAARHCRVISVYIFVCAPRFRIYFMFAWSVRVWVCVCVTSCWLHSKRPTMCWLGWLAGFILCLCASVASFTFFPHFYRVGPRNTPLCGCCCFCLMHRTVPRRRR